MNPISYCLLCSFFLALFLVRGALGLDALTLWAEDGTVFLPEAGLDTIFSIYAGYLTVVPRFFAWLGTYLPLSYIGTFYIAVSAFISCIPVFYFLSSRTNLFLPTITTKILACAGLVLAPGSSEVFGSLTNAQWYAVITIPTILFCKFRPVDIPVVIMLGLTGPFSFLTALIVAPFLLFRKAGALLFSYNKPAYLLTAFTGAVQAIFILFGERAETNHFILKHVIQASISDVSNSFLVLLLGSSTASEMMNEVPQVLVAECLLLFVIYSIVRDRLHPFFIVTLLLAFVCSFAAIVDNEVYRAVVKINLIDGSRYRFPLIAASAIFFCAQVRKMPLMFIPCFLMFLFGFRADFLHDRPSSGIDWQKAVKEHIQDGKVPIDPPGWVAFVEDNRT